MDARDSGIIFLPVFLPSVAVGTLPSGDCSLPVDGSNLHLLPSGCQAILPPISTDQKPVYFVSALLCRVAGSFPGCFLVQVQ